MSRTRDFLHGPSNTNERFAFEKVHCRGMISWCRDIVSILCGRLGEEWFSNEYFMLEADL